MNIKEYISSGILEAYALGDLSDLERAEVEQNLRLYPELQAELAQIEEAQEQLLMKTAIPPRAHVKELLLNRLKAAESQAKVLPISREPGFIWKYVAAASIVLAVVSSVFAYTYWNRWQQVTSDLSNLIAQNQQLADSYNQVNGEVKKLSEEIEVIGNSQFRKIIMTGTPNAPDALASVYWNEASNELFLKVENMQELGPDKQYQLWAIIDGKPVDAGTFDTNATRFLQMKNIGKGAATFAVTVEPRGGKESPTLETMQVAGNVTEG